MDDAALNPDPAIAAEAQKDGVNVDRVMSGEVRSPTISPHSPADSGLVGGGDGGAADVESQPQQGGGGSSDWQYGHGSSSGGHGQTQTERHDQRLLQDFPERGPDGSYNRRVDEMNDGMSISGSNDVDLLSQYFGSMSFTPESSELSFIINYG